MKKHSKCMVCEGVKLKQLKGYEETGLIKCRSCGFVFMEAIPSPEELDKTYSSYSYDSEGYLSPITIKSYNLLLDEFEKYRVTNKLLDVGCGRGWFLLEAKKRGWEAYGTEYSKTAVQLCREKGIRVIEGELDPSSFESNDFDIITSFEVIEHVQNPAKELASTASLLRKGGLFYCTTPNFSSLMRYYLKSDYNVINYPEHLSYFTKTTLSRIAGKHALKPVRFLSTGISITRLKTSTGASTEAFIAADSSDEVLRRNIESKWYLAIAKNAANKLLTLTNTGMTLKGYFEKV